MHNKDWTLLAWIFLFSLVGSLTVSSSVYYSRGHAGHFIAYSGTPSQTAITPFTDFLEVASVSVTNNNPTQGLQIYYAGILGNALLWFVPFGTIALVISKAEKKSPTKSNRVG